MPGSGEVKGLMQAFAGKDLVTGRELAWWEIGLNVVSALPVIHEVGTAAKLLKDGTKIAHAAEKVAHVAHTVHNFNKVIHASHAIHPIDVLVVDPARKGAENALHSGGEH